MNIGCINEIISIDQIDTVLEAVHHIRWKC